MTWTSPGAPNIGSSWTKSVLYSVFYSVHNLWEAVRNVSIIWLFNFIQVAYNFSISKHVILYTCYCLLAGKPSTNQHAKQAAWLRNMPQMWSQFPDNLSFQTDAIALISMSLCAWWEVVASHHLVHDCACHDLQADCLESGIRCSPMCSNTSMGSGYLYL